MVIPTYERVRPELVNMILKKFPHVSPEALKISHVSKKSDVYALGVIIMRFGVMLSDNNLKQLAHKMREVEVWQRLSWNAVETWMNKIGEKWMKAKDVAIDECRKQILMQKKDTN